VLRLYARKNPMLKLLCLLPPLVFLNASIGSSGPADLADKRAEIRKASPFALAGPQTDGATRRLEQQLGHDVADALQPEAGLAGSAELEEADRQGRLLYEAGRYGEAALYWEEAVALAERELGPDHPRIAMLLNNLALSYHAQRRYAEAEPLLRRALAIRERALRPDHPVVAASLSNLAELYRLQGRYAKAEPLHRRPGNPREGFAAWASGCRREPQQPRRIVP
jgi:tetratricopeptide (TPR) repeat protein